MATPSPVATEGFVVLSHNCPAPPVARRTAHPVIVSTFPESWSNAQTPQIPFLGSLCSL